MGTLKRRVCLAHWCQDFPGQAFALWRTVRAKNLRMYAYRVCRSQVSLDATPILPWGASSVAKELDLGSCRAEHWGKTETSRRFSNNVGGAGQKCGNVPISRQEAFFDLQMGLPAVGETSLNSIIMDHFAYKTEDVEPIKCSFCCPHDACPGVDCTCEKEEIVEKIHLTKAPTNIFVTLKRKTKTTRVTMQEEFQLEGTQYNLIGILSHRGETITSGHYFTYLRHNDSWFLHEDAHPATPIPYHEMNTSESYILLGRKCEASTEPGKGHKTPSSKRREISPPPNQPLPKQIHPIESDTDIRLVELKKKSTKRTLEETQELIEILESKRDQLKKEKEIKVRKKKKN